MHEINTYCESNFWIQTNTAWPPFNKLKVLFLVTNGAAWRKNPRQQGPPSKPLMPPKATQSSIFLYV